MSTILYYFLFSVHFFSIHPLSAGRVPKKVGKGYIGKHCEIPFTGASVTEGRKAIKRMFGMKALSELQIKF